MEQVIMGSVMGFLQAMGGRPVVQGFAANYLAGPFLLGGGTTLSIANGAATSVDMRTQQVWYGDAQVRAQYSPSSSSTSLLQGTLHLDGFEVGLVDGTAIGLVSTTKQKLFDTAFISISTTVQGVVRKFPVEEALSDWLVGAWAAATSSPATTAGTNIRGRPYILPSPLNINMNVDAFSLITEADAALGAATKVRVKLTRGSILVPNQDLTSDSGGASCSADGRGGLPAGAYRSAYLGAVSLARF